MDKDHVAKAVGAIGLGTAVYETNTMYDDPPADLTKHPAYNDLISTENTKYFECYDRLQERWEREIARGLVLDEIPEEHS